MPTKETSKILPEKITLDYSVEEGYNKIVNNDIVRRLNTGLGRTYFRDEDEKKKYIYSSTTIINVIDKGIGFRNWLKLYGAETTEIMQKAALKGTMIHVCCSIISTQGFLNTTLKIMDKGRDYEINQDIYNNIIAFKKFYNDYKPVIMAIELMLYDPDIPFAGTCDYIAFMKDKKTGEPQLCLIDIKSGKEYKTQHTLQLTSYKILFDKIFGEEFGYIDKIYCLYLRDTKGYTLKEYPYSPDEWYSTVHLFHFMNSNARNKMPKIKEEFQIPETINLKEEIENEPRK